MHMIVRGSIYLSTIRPAKNIENIIKPCIFLGKTSLEALEGVGGEFAEEEKCTKGGFNDRTRKNIV